jgi:hypothetical protein
VILGVPHHAAAGVGSICQLRLDATGQPYPRRADENAALYALIAYETLVRMNLPCKLIIMAHATTHDPNKIIDSPYCQELFADPGKLIFECHGSRGERLLDLELSAGKNPLPDTLAYGSALAETLEHRYSLGVQYPAGGRSALIFKEGRVIHGRLELPAHQTHSLIEAGRRGLPALHLEARPRFRRTNPAGFHLQEDGQRLGRAIARCIGLFQNAFL